MWHEYKLEHPDGVQYTQYCERYRKWIGTRQVSLHIQHKAGEKMFVDWVGDTMTVINPQTGEAITANLFVSAIGTSGYPYVEAFPTKEKANWIRAHTNAFRYYGGLPLILVSSPGYNWFIRKEGEDTSNLCNNTSLFSPINHTLRDHTFVALLLLDDSHYPPPRRYLWASEKHFERQ